MKMLKNVIGLAVLLLLMGLFQSATLPNNISMEASIAEDTSSMVAAEASLLVISLGNAKKRLVVTGVNNCAKYSWSTGEKTRSIVVENPGTYRVVVKDDCGPCANCWQELIETIVW